MDYRPYKKLEEFFIAQIMGAFSTFDMQALHSGCKRLKNGDVYVEVGTYYGRSTYCAMKFLPKGVKMYAVDIEDPGEYPGHKSRKQFWEETGLDERVTYIVKPSVEAAEEFKEKIDMIFIDADHSYEEVKSDVESWYPHMKPGGYMYFHDADDSSPGVWQLVEEMSKDKRFKDLVYYRDIQDNKTSVASLRVE